MGCSQSGESVCGPLVRYSVITVALFLATSRMRWNSSPWYQRAFSGRVCPPWAVRSVRQSVSQRRQGSRHWCCCCAFLPVRVVRLLFAVYSTQQDSLLGADSSTLSVRANVLQYVLEMKTQFQTSSRKRQRGDASLIWHDSNLSLQPSTNCRRL